MLRWTWLSAIVVFLDQFTKWTAESYLEYDTLTRIGTPHEVLFFLNWKLAYNEGAAFSFLAGQGGWQRWFFAVLAIAVSLFILNWLRTMDNRERWTAIGLALVLGGAIGNLIDRVMAGKVVDLIDVHFPVPYVNPDYHFATFNVADIAITMGAALLIIISLFAATREE